VPTLMVQELFFSMPTDVTPIIQGNVVATHVVNSPVIMVAILVVGSSVAEIDKEEEHVFQEPIANNE
jgi:hypothetical protein